MKVPMSDVDPSKVEGPDFPLPGSYHFLVQHVVEQDEKGNFYADLEILAGTTANQEGKTHREYFSLTPKAFGRLCQFGVVLGLVTQEQLQRAKDAGEDVDIPFHLAPGRQFCGELREEEYEGKKRNKLDFRMWAVTSEKAKGIPLNQGMLARLQELGGGAPPATAPAAGGGGAADDPFGGAF